MHANTAEATNGMRPSTSREGLYNSLDGRHVCVAAPGVRDALLKRPADFLTSRSLPHVSRITREQGDHMRKSSRTSRPGMGRISTLLSILGVAMFLGAFVNVPAASAGTMYGDYYRPGASSREGAYTLIDCRCPQDEDLTVSNFRNGYHVRVRAQAYVNGAYYTYADKTLSDGYSGKWKITLPTGKVRLVFNFYNSSWTPIAGDDILYGQNSY